MKDEWKQRSLKKSVHLTISGCLGPCDLHNVVSLSTAAGTVWLGGLRDFTSYSALLEWAVAIKEAGRALPIPEELTDFRFDPFRLPDSASPLAG
jgi:cobaltochelatase CobN